MNRRTFLASAAAVTAAGLAHRACAAPADGPTFSPEQLRADFAALYAGMKEAHFDLYAHTPKAVQDRAFRRTLAAIDRPMARTEAEVLFQTFLAVGRVAHARIDFPGQAWKAYRDGGGRALPLDVRVVKGRAYIARSYALNAAARPGDEIIEVDGEAAGRWLARLGRHVSADNAYMLGALIEYQVPRLVWLEYGPRATHSLTLRRGRETVRVVLPSLTSAERTAAAAKLPPAFEFDGYGRDARMLDGGLAYLKPGPFFNIENMERMYETKDFHAFIDRSFDQFLAAGATRLIVDMRENPGGDNSFSDHMVAWFADRPFRFCSSFRIKVSPQTRASNQARLDADPEAAKGVSGDFARLYAGARPGQVVDFPIAMAKPRDGRRFEGEVFMLINRNSFSNTVTVAALAQDYGFATIMGEETSDLASTYGAMEQFTLPVTGIPVGYPKARIIRPNGNTSARGVTPDMPIAEPIVPPVEDVVLKRAVELARGAPRRGS